MTRTTVPFDLGLALLALGAARWSGRLRRRASSGSCWTGATGDAGRR